MNEFIHQAEGIARSPVIEKKGGENAGGAIRIRRCEEGDALGRIERVRNPITPLIVSPDPPGSKFTRQGLVFIAELPSDEAGETNQSIGTIKSLGFFVPMGKGKYHESQELGGTRQKSN